MAPIGRAGLLQLLRGTRKPRQPRGIPRTIAGTVVAQTAAPEPKGSLLVEPYACTGPPMATCTPTAPSLSRGSLCRQSSAIRTGCANERPSGSVRGVPRGVVSLPGSYRQRVSGGPARYNCGNGVAVHGYNDAERRSHTVSAAAWQRRCEGDHINPSFTLRNQLDFVDSPCAGIIE
jgi:hypothetical protein